MARFATSNIKQIQKEVRKLKAQARMAGRAPVLAKESLAGGAATNVDAQFGKRKQLSSYINSMHYQVARRLYELLTINTPKKTGAMNGGWTTGDADITERLNRSNAPLPEEVANILSIAGSAADTINISNAVEYVKFVNYGTSTSEARMFVEMAMTRVKREALAKGIVITITGSA